MNAPAKRLKNASSSKTSTPRFIAPSASLPNSATKSKNVLSTSPATAWVNRSSISSHNSLTHTLTLTHTHTHTLTPTPTHPFDPDRNLAPSFSSSSSRPERFDGWHTRVLSLPVHPD